ncbi:fructose-bisphosphate aldolase class II/tagatose 1,6-diphosphate aldolase GatY/KbaY [Melghirimyces profundicolus]|uniref:Fructose-bisphosphate aldolase class II/tagatose 1,6-diphosphate aldolase GatY/KbaY n=1 Tax=Melghirimyces profundicolus TaxID=1242148 RepID=A0A2T6BD83_9BACL|nr:class II fructose-bisphosphate aldolase [Melghirimyces profundicolus]PTX53989.1 fructose-bisphosphate aldolase class II/tagatose 1,6-diphosphate aldolase GatY/KbaY [Melghirimyces profundicolus]
MPLTTTKEMLLQAYRDGYAVPAFPAHHLEIVKGVVEAAEETGSPVIMQTTPATVHHMGLAHLASMVRIAAEQAAVPVALHLDHGDSFNTVARCLRAGYTSVMIDGSNLPFEENVALVKRAVELAHAVDVPVEAELGTIGEAEETRSTGRYTDPAAAETFVRTTGVDFLAPSFGTAHGTYQEEVRLDLERLASISQRTGIPLVMHGASGVPREDLHRSIRRGICKVNFSTELKRAFADELRRFLTEHPGESDPRKIFRSAREAVKKVALEKIFWIRAENHQRSAQKGGDRS